MKKSISLLTSLFLIFLISDLHAQFPIQYGDFTTWTQDSMGNWDPDGWETSNLQYSSPTILQDSDRLGGAGYSVKFVSVLDATSGEYEDGVLTLPIQPFSGSTRPSTLTGFWKKVSASNSNVFGIEVYLYNSSGVEIGDGSAHTPLNMGVPNWTAFTAPISYTSNDPVSFYAIIIATFNFTNDPGMVSHIDDLAFDVSTGIQSNAGHITECFIRNQGGNYSLEITKQQFGEFSFQVFDINGRQIISESYTSSSAGRSSVPLNLGQFSSGLYFCKVIADGKVTVIKFYR